MEYEEEKKITDEWYRKAKEMTVDRMPEFLKEIDEFPHTYNTIVDGIVAVALAGVYAIEHGKHGGISGFQASIIDLSFVDKWGVREAPFKIMSYNDWLYPHMDYKTTSIDKRSFEELQKVAKKRLEETNYSVDESVLARWRLIARGELPDGFHLRED